MKNLCDTAKTLCDVAVLSFQEHAYIETWSMDFGFEKFELSDSDYIFVIEIQESLFCLFIYNSLIYLYSVLSLCKSINFIYFI